MQMYINLYVVSGYWCLFVQLYKFSNLLNDNEYSSNLKLQISSRIFFKYIRAICLTEERVILLSPQGIKLRNT